MGDFGRGVGTTNKSRYTAASTDTEREDVRVSDLYGMPELRADIKRSVLHWAGRIGYPLLFLAAVVAIGISALDTLLQLPALAHTSGLTGIKHTLDHWVLYTTKVGPLGTITAVLWLRFFEQLRKKPLTPELKQWLRRWSLAIGTFCMLLPYLLVALGTLKDAAPILVWTVGAAILACLSYLSKKIIDGAATSVGESLGKEIFARIRHKPGEDGKT